MRERVAVLKGQLANSKFRATRIRIAAVTISSPRQYKLEVHKNCCPYIADGVRIACGIEANLLPRIERFVPLQRSASAALDEYSAVRAAMVEDVMDKGQMLDMPHVDSRDVLAAEQSTLERQNAALQHQNAALRDDNEDLRASALWWKALYEEAQRRYSDLENSPKPRVISRVDVCFPMPSSSPAHTPRPRATARPL
jgi:hypothetical protein